MNNKAQFTLVCTCEIVMRTGETLDSSLGDKPCSDISRIVLCPLHDAAPAMYAIIKDMREAFYVKGTRKALLEVMERSKDVIAQAEGRQG